MEISYPISIAFLRLESWLGSHTQTMLIFYLGDHEKSRIMHLDASLRSYSLAKSLASLANLAFFLARP